MYRATRAKNKASVWVIKEIVQFHFKFNLQNFSFLFFWAAPPWCSTGLLVATTGVLSRSWWVIWRYECPPYHTTWLVLRWLFLLGITGFTGHSFRPNTDKGGWGGAQEGRHYPSIPSRKQAPKAFFPFLCTVGPCPLVATVVSRIGGRVMGYKDRPSLLIQDWGLR